MATVILFPYAIWVGVVWLVVRWLRRRNELKRPAAIAIMVAAVLTPYWDVILGIPVMYQQCQAVGGLRTSQPIELPLPSVYVRPKDPRYELFCGECLKLIIRGDATETQTQLALTYKGAMDELAYVKQPGPVRYWVAELGEPACAAFDRGHPKESNRREFWERIGGTSYQGRRCIAAENIPAITAEYEMVGPTLSEKWFGPILLRFREFELRHRAAELSTARLTHVMLEPWHYRLNRLEALPPIPRCPYPLKPAEITYQYLFDLIRAREEE
jgi:hypothetical protein